MLPYLYHPWVSPPRKRFEKNMSLEFTARPVTFWCSISKISNTAWSLRFWCSETVSSRSANPVRRRWSASSTDPFVFTGLVCSRCSGGRLPLPCWTRARSTRAGPSDTFGGFKPLYTSTPPFISGRHLALPSSGCDMLCCGDGRILAITPAVVDGHALRTRRPHTAGSQYGWEIQVFHRRFCTDERGFLFARIAAANPNRTKEKCFRGLPELNLPRALVVCFGAYPQEH